MIKLIASDMDGTLLDSNRNLNPEFHQVLKEIKSKNMLFSAVSGRDINALKKVFKGVEDDVIFASNNGNLIMYKDELIFENYMEKEDIDKIVPIIRKNAKRFTIYCSKDHVYSESIISVMLPKRIKRKIKYVKDITKVNDKIIKVTTLGTEKVVKKTLKAIEVLKDELMIAPSGSRCFDICRKGGNKKQAIELLQEKFNINFDETMVFGDHMNDLEMMESAFYSYAMENAEDEVKENARFVAKTNDENGVIEVIKEVALNNDNYHVAVDKSM